MVARCERKKENWKGTQKTEYTHTHTTKKHDTKFNWWFCIGSIFWPFPLPSPSIYFLDFFIFIIKLIDSNFIVNLQKTFSVWRHVCNLMAIRVAWIKKKKQNQIEWPAHIVCHSRMQANIQSSMQPAQYGSEFFFHWLFVFLFQSQRIIRQFNFNLLAVASCRHHQSNVMRARDSIHGCVFVCFWGYFIR